MNTPKFKIFSFPLNFIASDIKYTPRMIEEFASYKKLCEVEANSKEEAKEIEKILENRFFVLRSLNSDFLFIKDAEERIQNGDKYCKEKWINEAKERIQILDSHHIDDLAVGAYHVETKEDAAKSNINLYELMKGFYKSGSFN